MKCRAASSPHSSRLRTFRRNFVKTRRAEASEVTIASCSSWSWSSPSGRRRKYEIWHVDYSHKLFGTLDFDWRTGKEHLDLHVILRYYYKSLFLLLKCRQKIPSFRSGIHALLQSKHHEIISFSGCCINTMLHRSKYCGATSSHRFTIGTGSVFFGAWFRICGDAVTPVLSLAHLWFDSFVAISKPEVCLVVI